MSVMYNPNLSYEKKKKLGDNPYDTYTTLPYKLGSRQSLKEVVNYRQRNVNHPVFQVT